MKLSSKYASALSFTVAAVFSVMLFIPVFLTLTELPEDLEDYSISDVEMVKVVHTCLDPPPISPAEDGSYSKEEVRLIRALTDVQATCDRVELPGKPDHQLTTDRQDLRGNSYVCVGGLTGLRKYNCLVYSFGIKHSWVKFPELVEKYLGCQVYGFDPDLDYIDHYHTKNVRFFNAKLSDFDRQAHYNPPKWKYRTFLTLIKELHFVDEPIDHVRLDITLDAWGGMSKMLQDGSLLTFVKQLSLEYDLNKKNVTQVREMFTLTQWLNKQGFLLAHSQQTKISGKSYSVLYINTKIGMPLYDSKIAAIS